jgi:hypothetical protein
MQAVFSTSCILYAVFSNLSLKFDPVALFFHYKIADRSEDAQQKTRDWKQRGRVSAANVAKLIQKIAVQSHLVAENCVTSCCRT